MLFSPTFFFIQFHNFTESTSQEPIALNPDMQVRTQLLYVSNSMPSMLGHLNWY